MGVLIAFTGSHTIEQDGKQVSVTEGKLNGQDAEGRSIQDERIADALRSTHRILIAVDKFQTGFSEPKLLAMYVDKRLRGINAVQTLSRLNRPFPGKGPQLRATDAPPVFPFVVDFYDNVAQVLEAFTRYDKEALPETFVPKDLLLKLGGKIRAVALFSQETLDQVWTLWESRHAGADSAAFHALLNRVLDAFFGLPDDQARTGFRHLLRRFLYYWSAAHEVVTHELGPAERLTLSKQALLYAKLLPTLNDWSPSRDDQPPQHLRADHISFDDQDLQYVATQALLPVGSDDYADPREITVGQPRERRFKTLRELVDAFNQQHGGAATTGEDDTVDQLELAVEDAVESMAPAGTLDLEAFRRRLEPALRRSLRKAEDLERPLKRFIFADTDRFDTFANRVAEDSFALLKGA